MRMTVASYRSMVNNAQGRLLEEMIEGAARAYKLKGRAQVIKTPEPFRVLKKDRQHGRAMVQFTAHAQPDFLGCLAGGQMIAFEAKHTSKDRINQSVVTDTQAAALDNYTKLGARTGVCCCIHDTYFMVPWEVWRQMGTIYGRKYATKEDFEPFRVPCDGVVRFLDSARGRQAWE